MIKYFCDRCAENIVSNQNPQIIEYTYELPEPTDEEIQKEIDTAELTGVVKPEDVRKYIHERLYELYRKAVSEKKENNDG